MTTAYTLSLAGPAKMAAEATAMPACPILKLKLDADDPLARLAAVRAARPDAVLLIDANGAWTLELLREIAPRLANLGVAMVEQPLPPGADEELVRATDRQDVIPYDGAVMGRTPRALWG